VVFGSRFKGRGRGATPLVGYAGNLALTMAADALFLARLTDILTCYKVMRSEVARSLELRCNGFDLDAEITCRLLRDGHRIVEVPITYNARRVEEGKKLSPGVGWSVLRAIVRVRFSARGRRPTSRGPRERASAAVERSSDDR
jgi:hypothetical protein